ncbi:hypothetical protein ATK74_0398 [Propionicimonas paludicola]|uniref:Uncharacterized protein n=1 Tax=Propionicimonas paludicola TaxID=185243 RepID=A0A2A9CN49_9ACTN|nr:hypothetical protein [Propionicimonas paludicola]PFG15877.1 hypothetical protein ATK74_0398 [Propionicimonas paludicola]
MSNPRPPALRTDLLRAGLIAVAIAGVVVSIAMVILGLPEATPAQSVLLELAMLPISVSLAAALGILAMRARPAGRRSRLTLTGSGILGIAGATTMALAYVTGPRPLVHLGQALLLVGLLIALAVATALQPGRRRSLLELADEPDETEPDTADPQG